MRYHGTHSCGHEGAIDLIGPTSQREWRSKKYFEGECPDYLQKLRDAESAAAHSAGRRFVGTELNHKRLSVLVEAIAKTGMRYYIDKKGEA